MKKIILATGLAISMLLGQAQPSHAAMSVRANLNVDTGDIAYKSHVIYLQQDEALKEAALKEVRNIRSKLWDENVIYTENRSANPGNERLQDVARKYGYTDKESYVNAVVWSNDVERIAIQRTYEQIYNGLSHTRPDGSRMGTVITENGIGPNAEILAANWQPMTPAIAFDQWAFAKSSYWDNKSEYDLLLEANGVINDGNGHLHIILDPSLEYIGYAQINSDQARYNFAGANFASNYSANFITDFSATNMVGEYRLYVGEPTAADIEAENLADQRKLEEKRRLAEQMKKLEKAVDDAQRQIDIAENLLKNYPKTVKNVRGKLIKQIDQSRNYIAEARKLLREFK